MQSENFFDRFSKRVAIAVSRRSLLRSLSVAVAGACLPWTKAFGQDPPKRPAAPRPNSTLGFMESPDYETVVVEKRIIKPGSSLSDPSKLKEFPPYCGYLIELRTVPGVAGGLAPFRQTFYCDAKNGICPSIMDCKRAPESQELRSYLTDSSSKADALRNRFGDKCKRDGRLEPEKASTLAFFDSNGELLEELCIQRYSCENSGLGFSFCPSTPEVSVVGGKETIKRTCPRVNSCINEEIPRVQGYTQAELDAMPEDKRKETLRMLAEPAVPYKKST